MKILVAEDDALIAMMLCDALRDDGGHEVLGPAATVSDALAMCEAGPPDLAVLDISLSEGGNGTDLARALHGRWSVWSIFASGQVDDARRARDVALGCITKPYDPGLVVRSVEVARHLLDGRTPATVPAGLELFR